MCILIKLLVKSKLLLFRCPTERMGKSSNGNSDQSGACYSIPHLLVSPQLAWNIEQGGTKNSGKATKASRTDARQLCIMQWKTGIKTTTAPKVMFKWHNHQLQVSLYHFLVHTFVNYVTRCIKNYCRKKTTKLTTAKETSQQQSKTDHRHNHVTSIHVQKSTIKSALPPKKYLLYPFTFGHWNILSLLASFARQIPSVQPSSTA